MSNQIKRAQHFLSLCLVKTFSKNTVSFFVVLTDIKDAGVVLKCLLIESTVRIVFNTQQT